MAYQLDNMDSLKRKKRDKDLEETRGQSQSASQLVSKYQQAYFSGRSISLGKLISTTDRVLQTEQDQVSALHKVLDRVEIDRPYLIKDKVSLIASLKANGSDGSSYSSVSPMTQRRLLSLKKLQRLKTNQA
jgi:hypothetical protein